jgi:hypothetical protein
MGGVGGLLGGKSKTSSSQETRAYVPSWAKKPLIEALDMATAAARQPFSPYTDQRVADFTQDELDAFQLTRDTMGRYTPYVEGTYSTFEDIMNQGRTGINPELVQSYMNPYVTNVLDTTLQRDLEDFDRAKRDLNTRLAQTSAFGGSRSGFATSDLYDDFRQRRSETEANLLAQAYESSLANAFKSLSMSGAAATDLANTANLGQSMSLRDAAALQTVGATQRDREQAELDFNYNEFMRETAFPYEQAQFLAGIANPIANTMRGSTTTTTNTQSGGSSGILGAALGLGSMAMGIPGVSSALGGGLSSMFGQSAAMGLGAFTGAPSSFYSGVFPSGGGLSASAYGMGSQGGLYGFNKGGLVATSKYQEGGYVKDPDGLTWEEKRDFIQNNFPSFVSEDPDMLDYILKVIGTEEDTFGRAEAEGEGEMLRKQGPTPPQTSGNSTDDMAVDALQLNEIEPGERSDQPLKESDVEGLIETLEKFRAFNEIHDIIKGSAVKRRTGGVIPSYQEGGLLENLASYFTKGYNSASKATDTQGLQTLGNLLFSGRPFPVVRDETKRRKMPVATSETQKPTGNLSPAMAALLQMDPNKSMKASLPAAIEKDDAFNNVVSKYAAPAEESPENIINSLINQSTSDSNQMATGGYDELLSKYRQQYEQTEQEDAQGINTPLIAFGAALLGGEEGFFKALGDGVGAYRKEKRNIQTEKLTKEEAIRKMAAEELAMKMDEQKMAMEKLKIMAALQQDPLERELTLAKIAKLRQNPSEKDGEDFKKLLWSAMQRKSSGDPFIDEATRDERLKSSLNDMNAVFGDQGMEADVSSMPDSVVDFADYFK